jgi:hypothetical protein
VPTIVIDKDVSIEYFEDEEKCYVYNDFYGDSLILEKKHIEPMIRALESIQKEIGFNE